MTAPPEVRSQILPFLKSNFLILFCLLCAASMCTAAPFLSYKIKKKQEEGASAPEYPETEKGCYGPYGAMPD